MNKSIYTALFLSLFSLQSCIEKIIPVHSTAFQCEAYLENETVEDGGTLTLILETNRDAVKVESITGDVSFKELYRNAVLSTYGGRKTFTSEALSVDREEERTLTVTFRDTTTSAAYTAELLYYTMPDSPVSPTSIIVAEKYKNTFRLDYGQEENVTISVYPTNASHTLIITPDGTEGIHKGSADESTLDKSTISYSYRQNSDGTYLLTVKGGNVGQRSVTFNIVSRANPLISQKVTFYVRQRLGLWITGTFEKGYTAGNISKEWRSFNVSTLSTRLVTWTGSFTETTEDHLKGDTGFTAIAFPKDVTYSMAFRYKCQVNSSEYKNWYRNDKPAPDSGIAFQLTKKESGTEKRDNGYNILSVATSDVGNPLNYYSSVRYQNWIRGHYDNYSIQLSSLEYDTDKYYIQQVFHAYKRSKNVDEKNRSYWWQFVDTDYWTYGIDLNNQDMVSILK